MNERITIDWTNEKYNKNINHNNNDSNNNNNADKIVIIVNK